MTTAPFNPFDSPHVHTYANRDEWLAARTARAPDGHPSIGASDIGSIFGCGFRSPAETALIMRGIAPREPDSDDPMNPLNVGSRLEAVALAEYALITGQDEPDARTISRITRWTHPDHPWLSVSPDALVYEGPVFDDILVEIGRAHV
jgi:predicted phage-related endonuclease